MAINQLLANQEAGQLVAAQKAGGMRPHLDVDGRDLARPKRLRAGMGMYGLNLRRETRVEFAMCSALPALPSNVISVPARNLRTLANMNTSSAP